MGGGLHEGLFARGSDRKAVANGMPLDKTRMDADGASAPQPDTPASGAEIRVADAQRDALQRRSAAPLALPAGRVPTGIPQSTKIPGHAFASGPMAGGQRATPGTTIENEIGPALENGQFELFLQPQIDLQHFTIAGAEALLRWRHPKRGLITPALFLPAAEASNQIRDLGRWVRRTACENFRTWRGWMGENSRIALNVSPSELLDPRFLPETLSALAAHGIPDSAIEFELLETAVLANPEAARETIHHLRRHGVRMALDDFGVGYSSLSSLRDYPFTKLKIDRSFIQNLTASHRSRTIVQSMIELGKSLQTRVNAEGVETPEQLQCLYEHGCHEVQGYLFARPMPVARFRDWCSGFQGKHPANRNTAIAQDTSGTRPGNVLDFPKGRGPAQLASPRQLA